MFSPLFHPILISWNYFAFILMQKYKEAIDQLEKLVGTNISQQTRNRAYFYLGESHYMLAQYPRAIKTFVRIENVYPALCKQWIDNSLDQL